MAVRTRVYPHTATAAAFLLGGIGTGNVSLDSRGCLRDWEIFNRPAKGCKLPFTFFALRAKPDGGEPIARVLEGPMQPPFTHSHGINPGEVGGLPRFAASELCGEYPFAHVVLSDPALALAVELEAFTPFVPLDADASGIPAAFLRYRVRNTGSRRVDLSIVGSLPNVCGYRGANKFGGIELAGPVSSELVLAGAADAPAAMTAGLRYSPLQIDPTSPELTTLALMTTAPRPTHRREWLPVHWVDHIQDFWDDFASDGRLEPEATIDAPSGALASEPARLKIGSVGGSRTLEPDESGEFEFVIAWHCPNRAASWDQAAGEETPRSVRNYYATLWPDAWTAARHLLDNLPELERRSRAFHDALFGSTLPPEVIDAAAANLTVLRSPTCYRLEDGAFLGWEGCFDSAGCCPGSCTHVWNYAQSVAFLFPELERSMRRIELGVETDESGSMAFRTMQVYGLPRWEMLPATDGQLGTIVRLYREWSLCGDDEFLRALWPKAALALDFAFEYWDQDDDDVLDSRQHNTYDIEFHGPNSLSNSFFYAALAAGERMAARVGDTERELRYREARERGSARMDEMLWNGEYYEQRIDDVDAWRYQYGRGCLSDQVIGQYLAHVAGLGHILPADHVKQAVQAVVRHNFREDVGSVASVQRTYALPGESGLLLCSWPRGGRPRIPFVYSDEVWTGIEYQVAAHCFYEGLVDEGLRIVRAARGRHDGVRRNPWNEVECGHHYARSMASWALVTGLSGFRCSLPDGEVSFSPRINADDFRCFFSTGRSWGVFHQRRANGEVRQWLDVIEGEPVPGWDEQGPPRAN